VGAFADFDGTLVEREGASPRHSTKLAPTVPSLFVDLHCKSSEIGMGVNNMPKAVMRL
jgi:hypothetical protein